MWLNLVCRKNFQLTSVRSKEVFTVDHGDGTNQQKDQHNGREEVGEARENGSGICGPSQEDDVCR